MLLEIGYHEKGADKLTNKKHSGDGSYEIIQTVSNSGKMIIKDELYPIIYGAVYLINAVDPHCSVPDDVDEYTRNKIVISSDRLDYFLSQINCVQLTDELFKNTASACIRFETGDIDEVNNLFFEIYNLAKEKSSAVNAEIFSKILHLLYICAENSNKAYVHTNDCVSKTLAYINCNITSDLNLDIISRELYINKFYLCRQFKKSTNMTILEYIKKRRLSIAKKKLLYTGMSISNIADSAGFSSFSYFSNIFKKAEGVTPSEYRALNGHVL